MAHIQIDETTQAVVKIEQLNQLQQQRDKALTDLAEYRRKEQILYNNIKEILSALPVKDGGLDMDKLPGLLGGLLTGGSGGLMKKIEGPINNLSAFLTDYETRNGQQPLLTVVK